MRKQTRTGVPQPKSADFNAPVGSQLHTGASRWDGFRLVEAGSNVEPQGKIGPGSVRAQHRARMLSGR
jgi:hypothetical protein